MTGYRTAAAALAAVLVLFGGGTSAQSLTVGLFERYLEPLRVQSGIPGLSAAILQNGRIVWERGLGLADVERAIATSPLTPYPLADLTQVFGATLLMQRAERGELQITDPIARWTNLIDQPGVSLSHVLTHASTGAFRYDPARFAALTPVIERQAGQPFRRVLADEILDRVAMFDSVPGETLATPTAVDLQFFDQAHLERYAAVLQRLATPYRVEARRAIRGEYSPSEITAATGLISTVRDLARFDGALDAGVLVGSRSLVLMWNPAPIPGGSALMPFGHGWFVQGHRGHSVLWHFGVAHGAFSSLIIKIPARELTLILLANSDGLAAPFALSLGDVTTSPYARLFLRVFLG